MRVSEFYTIDNPSLFKEQLLHWAQQFREVAFLDSNSYPQAYSSYDCMLAVDAFTLLQTDYHNAFEDLKQYQQTTKDWLFGYLSYDLKNDSERLQSNNFDGLDFPDLFFFQPKKIFLLKGNQLETRYLHLCDDELQEDYQDITTIVPQQSTASDSVMVQARIDQKNTSNKYKKCRNTFIKGIFMKPIFVWNFMQKTQPFNRSKSFKS